MKLLIISGFLGAGKTTFLETAARILSSQGMRVGLITNDQAEGLVDTSILSRASIPMREISGSCFCCNLNGFEEAIRQVGEEQVDVILAEPVGSCTDLVATILRPLSHRSNVQLAPLIVLADPFRLTDILEGGNAGYHPDSAYIYGKQLEESDLLLITKTDLLPEGGAGLPAEKVRPKFPDLEIRTASPLTGEGMEAILHQLLHARFHESHRIDVDYDRYASGEAVLGWLNGTILLKGYDMDWDTWARQLLQRLSVELERRQVSIGHIKLILENGENYLIGNLTGPVETLAIRGKAGTGAEVKLTINARAGLPPDLLEELVRHTIDELSSAIRSLEVKVWQCFSPSYPTPTVRLN